MRPSVGLSLCLSVCPVRTTTVQIKSTKMRKKIYETGENVLRNRSNRSSLAFTLEGQRSKSQKNDAHEACVFTALRLADNAQAKAHRTAPVPTASSGLVSQV